MGFIPAKCTQCGAEITVDDTMDAGICEYCGMAFVTEKAINNYNTYVTHNYDGATVNIVKGNPDNLISLAETALYANNFKEANDFANKALEIDTTLAKAWLVKLKAAAEQLDVKSCDDNTFQELSSYGNSAVIYSDEMDYDVDARYVETEKTANGVITKEVYTTYLLTASQLINEAVTEIHRIPDMLYHPIDEDNKYNCYDKDFPARNRANTLATNGVWLVLDIPPFYFKYISYLDDLMVRIVESYVEFCKGDKFRLGLCKYEVDEHFINERFENIQELNKRLPEGRTVPVPILREPKEVKKIEDRADWMKGNDKKESKSIFKSIAGLFSKK